MAINSPEIKSNINEIQKAKTPFSVIEAYKNIRLKIINNLDKSGGKIIAISSPNASEGKSTTSVNLAITFAQLNKKVLVIDADTRRSTIHTKLKLENNIGFLDVLSNNSKFEDAVINYKNNLDVLTAGVSSNIPSELLSSIAFDQLLTKISSEYDYIIIDTPPLNIVSDGFIIAQKCDGLVLVIRSNLTTYESFKFALAEVNELNINIFGVVINDTKSSSNKYYKYKYSSYK